jgi:hypothetical protein
MLNHDNDTNDKRNGGSSFLAFVIEHLSALSRAVENAQRMPPKRLFAAMRVPYRIATIMIILCFLIIHSMKYHETDTYERYFNALSSAQKHVLLADVGISVGIIVGFVLGIWFAYRAVRAFVVRHFAKRLAPEESHSIAPLLNTLQIALCVGVIFSIIATTHTRGIHPHLALAFTITSYAFAAAVFLTGACKKHVLKIINSEGL